MNFTIADVTHAILSTTDKRLRYKKSFDKKVHELLFSPHHHFVQVWFSINGVSLHFAKAIFVYEHDEIDERALSTALSTDLHLAKNFRLNGVFIDDYDDLKQKFPNFPKMESLKTQVEKLTAYNDYEVIYASTFINRRLLRVSKS